MLLKARIVPTVSRRLGPRRASVTIHPPIDPSHFDGGERRFDGVIGALNGIYDPQSGRISTNGSCSTGSISN